MTKKLEFSRRDFIGGAGAALLGIGTLGFTGCAPHSNNGNNASSSKTANQSDATKDYSISNTVDCDVAIVGAGASGISCAVHAAEKGLNAILLEKTSSIGGASNQVFSAMVRKPEEVGTAVNEWTADCHWKVDTTAICNILSHSEEVFNWLTKFGWSFSEMNTMGTMNWMIVTSYDQRPILYKTMCDQTGVDIRNNMTAKKLVTNSDGAVTGVIALSDDNVATQFNAKAVVIATGGYAGNDNMVKEAFGRSPLCGGLPQNIGEGLEMCWAIGGAKPRNYGMQMPHQTYVSASKRLASDYDDLKAKYPFLAAYAPCFLNTTAKGRRFRNEANLYNADAAANSDMYQGDYHWTIVSASQLATLETSGLAALGVDEKLTISPIQAPTYNLDTPWVDATTVFNKMVENGDGYKGSDAKSLAKAAGMDPEIFQNELEKYEKSCSTGQDYVCGKDSKYLAAYGSGDLYAIYTSVNNLTSCGGVTVDTDFNVLDSSENKIDGLYAIGVECLSNLFSDTYTGVGAALVTSYTSGYLVAETLLNA